MKGLIIFALLCLSALPAAAQGTCPSGAPVTGTNCYFISASGSDTNNGTSESTPWLHAPGMPNCSNTCASTTPAVGNGFIFRGGDTWHTSNPSPSSGVYIGQTTGGACVLGGTACGWGWTWSGSSTNCNYPTTTTSCIYIGVDQNWYTGGSWTRPSIYMDNAATTSLQSTCPSYDQSNGPLAFSIGATSGSQANYVIFDNFELHGYCNSSASGASNPGGMVQRYGKYITIINCYFHGWISALASSCNTGGGCGTDRAPKINYYPNGVTGAGNIVAYNIIDGSDTYCTGNRTCAGGISIAGDAENVHHNVFRYVSGGIAGMTTIGSIHDNLFEDLFESYDAGVHGDVVFNPGNAEATGSSIYFYNNIIRNTGQGQTVALGAANEGYVYIFNNVLWNIGNGSNCIALYNNTTSAAYFYIANNTIDAVDNVDSSTCTVQGTNPNPDVAAGNLYFENNHLVGYSSLSSLYSVSSLTVTNNGGEVLQTESAANGQGYTESNNYQPTSSSNATVHAGVNLSSSCSTYSTDSALCNGTTGGETSTAGSGVLSGLYIPSPPARGTTFDAGAYEFNPGSSSQPAAPSGLTATVAVQ